MEFRGAKSSATLLLLLTSLLLFGTPHRTTLCSPTVQQVQSSSSTGHDHLSGQQHQKHLATHDNQSSPISPIETTTTITNTSSSSTTEKPKEITTTSVNLPQAIIETTTTPASQKVAASGKISCDQTICSKDQFVQILNRISNQDERLLVKIKELDSLDLSKYQQQQTINRNQPVAALNASVIELFCLRDVMDLIRELASNELELREIIDLANDVDFSASYTFRPMSNQSNLTSIQYRHQQLRRLLSSSSGGLAETRNHTSPESASSRQNSPLGRLQFDRACNERDSSSLAADSAFTASTGSGIAIAGAAGGPPAVRILVESPALDKSRATTKAIANVDHWIGSLERFVATNEWSSLRKVLLGMQSIMETFNINLGPAPKSSSTSFNSKNSSSSSSKQQAINTKNNTTISSQQVEETIERLKLELPEQVQSLANSLNNLFPWHIWPWNNIELYTTIEGFLNHAIFALSETSQGSNPRIAHIFEMLETLIKSLKLDNFPKKCTDWSKIICDQNLYSEWLNTTTTTGTKSSDQSNGTSNNTVQELTCIMFSSMSVQKFGSNGSQIDDWSNRLALNRNNLANRVASNQNDSMGAQNPASNLNHLSWDKQVLKGLRVYNMSREALTKQQWVSLYKLAQDIWSQQKISDRVIMSCRVVQLLTSCRMPREVLESALWKDIYKYKNALNQLVDIVIEEMNRSSETGQFTIDQMALGSKHLHEILVHFLKLLPKLLESLTQTFVDDLPELVNRFFYERHTFFKVPCKGHSFADIIGSLARHKNELVQLEEMVCKQLDTKPNISMMKINQFTNEFLAMAFNFTNFNNALGLPQLVGVNQPNQPGDQLVNGRTTSLPIESNPGNLGDKFGPGPSENSSSQSLATDPLQTAASEQQVNLASGLSREPPVASILDEMAANQRLAQIVAILQSSALDPPEVQADLPELDWVEAGTSVALLYESMQKLLSFEGVFNVFPELENFQIDMKNSMDKNEALFKQFIKRDPLRLLAYSLDTIMPVALRTFKTMGSFNGECLTSFRDLIGEDNEGKVARQYQCFVSSLNFASWATNQLMRTFNDMFASILSLTNNNNHPDIGSVIAQTATPTIKSNQTGRQMNIVSLMTMMNETNIIMGNGTIEKCVFLDGSINYLASNMPHLIDLLLETGMTISMFPDQQSTIESLICDPNSYRMSLFPDEEEERDAETQAKVRSTLCKMMARESLDDCRKLLKFEDWVHVMSELSKTWFEASPISIEPSFRGVTDQAHRFLKLFGQFKPATFSQGPIGSLFGKAGKPANLWTGNGLNKLTEFIRRYSNRRFELAIQILTPIIADNLPASAGTQSNSSQISNQTNNNSTLNSDVQSNSARSELDADVRRLVVASSLTTQAVISYLAKENNSSRVARLPTRTRFESQIAKVLEWADTGDNSLVAAEVLLRTLARNSSQLEALFLQTEVSKGQLSLNDVWLRFCVAPIGTYLNIEPTLGNQTILPTMSNETSTTTETPISTSNQTQIMDSARAIVCNFEWASLENEIKANEKSISGHGKRQLIRVALSKWGHLLDLVMSEQKPLDKMPNFLQMRLWQSVQEKLGQLSPNPNEPSNILWVWRAFERVLVAMDGNSTRTVASMSRVLDQFNCALDAIKGGLTWDNLANIYQEKHDVLAAHTTLNNIVELATIAYRTVMDQDRFQLALERFVKPKSGFKAFCELRDRDQLASIFSLGASSSDHQSSVDGGDDNPMDSLQELLCDTNLESIMQNINPISSCYVISQPPQSGNSSMSINANEYELANSIDRMFKLTSLAILDAKLVASTSPKSPLFDKFQTLTGTSSLVPASSTAMSLIKINVSLTAVRLLQMMDTINPNQFVWRAIFKSLHEMSEFFAYLARALNTPIKSESQQRDLIGMRSRIQSIQRALRDMDQAIVQHHVVSSTNQTDYQSIGRKLSGLMSSASARQNGHISYKTYKQLRYIRSIVDYFTSFPSAQKSLCSNSSQFTSQARLPKPSRLDLIGYKLDTMDKLYGLLCHYPPSQWLRVLNIVISSDTTIISKKINLITRHLAIFTRNYRGDERMKTFIHGKQLKNIEATTNMTINYLIDVSSSTSPATRSTSSSTSNQLPDEIPVHFRWFSYERISNFSLNSLPSIMDSMDQHVCNGYQPTSLVSNQTSNNNNNNNGKAAIAQSNKSGQVQSSLAAANSNKLELEVIVCQMPQWSFSKIYGYFSEKFDLHNLISLMAPDQMMMMTSNHSDTGNSSDANINNNNYTTATPTNQTCISPYRLAARWIRLVQNLSKDLASKSARERTRKCLKGQRKGQSAYSLSLTYVRLLNNGLNSIENLVRSDSWLKLKSGWNSISYYLLHETPAYIPKQLY